MQFSFSTMHHSFGSISTNSIHFTCLLKTFACVFVPVDDYLPFSASLRIETQFYKIFSISFFSPCYLLTLFLSLSHQLLFLFAFTIRIPLLKVAHTYGYMYVSMCVFAHNRRTHTHNMQYSHTTFQSFTAYVFVLRGS